MKKKKIPLRITGFTVLVLVLLAFLLFFRNGNNNDPLFDTNNSTTLYLETVAGKVPEIDFSIYFPGTDYDFTKFDYDKSTIDFQTPGTYTVPVYYNGQITSCMLQLTLSALTQNNDVLPETELKNPESR